MQLTRRVAIGFGVSAVALAGCHDKRPAVRPEPLQVKQPPDADALGAARHGELQLLAAYDTQIKHTPLHKRGPLQVERAIHATHLSALHGIEGTTQVTAPDSVEHTLRASANRLRRLSLAATQGVNAALLASIAASHTASAS